MRKLKEKKLEELKTSMVRNLLEKRRSQEINQKSKSKLSFSTLALLLTAKIEEDRECASNIVPNVHLFF